MSATVGSVRLLAVRELMQLVRDEIVDGVDRPGRVQVCAYDPGRELQQEAIYVVDVEGDVDAPYIAGGTDQPTEDEFAITLVCRAGIPGGTADATLDRVDELYRAVRRAVLSDEYGSTLDELADGDGAGVISSTTLSTVDGPLAGPSDDGYLGLYRVEVVVITDEVSA